MNYSNIKFYDIANGAGVRTSLFVSGCARHCKGCFNEEAWSFTAGNEFTEDTLEAILKSLAPSYIDGLSILGGEPLEPTNAIVVLDIVKAVRKQYNNTKTIWIYTGFTWDELFDTYNIDYDDILSQIDVLVDGPYIETESGIFRFKGSSNQRIIDCHKTYPFRRIVLWDDGEIFNNHDSYSGYKK